jgi:bifunctional non-homologous end joining protein LigD
VRPRFLVQAHRARGLRYDFRLEAEGELKSWTLPAEPPAAPAEKRLAIPAGNCDADFSSTRAAPESAAAITWDTGTYDNQSRDPDGRPLSITEAISRGHVSLVLHGKKLHGGYSLTRMRHADGQAWLLVKKADRFTGGSPVPQRR